jgi:regulator of replication initiation timing
MTTIDLVPESEDLALRVRELSERLERERARNAGLEQGIGALTERVEALRLENLELRRKLEHCR